MSDIIAAVATGWQASAIGIIRMSGAGCIQLAHEVFTPQYPNAPSEYIMAYSHTFPLKISTSSYRSR